MTATLDKSYVLHTGEVKALDGSGDEMLISGWASTKDLDLANDIVLPTAFAKHWDFYATKGRYWLDHNPSQVIGRVRKTRLLEDGFYIDEAKLSPTDFVKSYVWPNVKEGALNEHSIQFMSIKPEMKGGILYHKEVKLIETSIVSVACNPGAVITGFKGLIPSEDYMNANLAQLMELDRQGLLKYPGKQFAVSGFRDDQNTEEEIMTTPNVEAPVVDLVDIKVIARTKTGYDPKGTVKAGFKMPSTKSRTYEDVANLLYLAKSGTRKKHMFRVAVMTEKGWAYDWTNSAISMGTILGAKGAAHYADGEKLLLLKEMFTVYAALGKKLPMHDGESLDNLSDACLVALKFHEVDFAEGEDEVLRIEVAKASLKQLADTIQGWQKSGTVPADFVAYAKSVYSSVSFSFSVYPRDQDDVDLINALTDIVNTFIVDDPIDNGNNDYYAYSLDGLSADEAAKIRLARLGQKMLEGVDAKYLEAKAAGAAVKKPDVSKKSWIKEAVEAAEDDVLDF